MKITLDKEKIKYYSLPQLTNRSAENFSSAVGQVKSKEKRWDYSHLSFQARRKSKE